MFFPYLAIKRIRFTVIFLLYCFVITAQDSLSYRLDAFGSVSSQDITPFWMVNNTYGTVPLQSGNAYGRADVRWNHRFHKDFLLQSEADVEAATRHSSSFFIQQLYASLTYKSVSLTVGSKEYYNSMLDKNLSLGDFNYSPNARPIPEINLSIPEFTAIPYTKGILQVRGDFAVGRSTDNGYTTRTVYPGGDYTIDVLWHHKSLFLQLQDPKHQFPFLLTLGLEHAVQWGGWTTVEDMGSLPHSFRDFIRVVLGEGGGEDASLGEQVNVLGNHQGTYNVKVGYRNKSFEIGAYKQHYFDDASGMEYANWRDGIWGVECSLKNQNFLKKVVLEYLNTTDQSGPMHFLQYNKDGARGGGNDDYYNNGGYPSGWSHWGRTLGNALMTSPEYSKDGRIYFQNNRVKAIHLGAEGEITDALSYRVLASGMEAWGRMEYPFQNKKDDFSFLLECGYLPSQWKGWKFTLQTAFDSGSLYGDNLGMALKISKSGLIFF